MVLTMRNTDKMERKQKNFEENSHNFSNTDYDKTE